MPNRAASERDRARPMSTGFARKLLILSEADGRLLLPAYARVACIGADGLAALRPRAVRHTLRVQRRRDIGSVR